MNHSIILGKSFCCVKRRQGVLKSYLWHFGFCRKKLHSIFLLLSSTTAKPWLKAIKNNHTIPPSSLVPVVSPAGSPDPETQSPKEAAMSARASTNPCHSMFIIGWGFRKNESELFFIKQVNRLEWFGDSFSSRGEKKFDVSKVLAGSPLKNMKRATNLPVNFIFTRTFIYIEILSILKSSQLMERKMELYAF